jgi:hypothetical protein
MSEEQNVNGTDLGSINPTPDANDDSLLDSLGFGSQTPPVTQQVSEPAPAPVVEPSGAPINDPSLDLPEDVLPSAPVAPQTPAPAVNQPVEPQPLPETKFTDPKANHAFAELRAKNTEQTKRLQQLEAELTQARNTGPAVEEIKSQYEERIRQLEDQLGQHDLASTSGFRQKYDVVLTSMLGKVGNMLKKAGASEEEAQSFVTQLRSKNTVQRAQDLNDFAPALAGPIVNVLEDFDDLLLKRETELRNWRESKDSIAEEEKRINKSRTFEATESVANSVLEELAVEKNPFFTKSSTNEQWNQNVDKRVSAYKGLLKTGDPAVLAKLVAEGIAAQDFQRLYFAEKAKRMEYQKALEERRSILASPGQRSGDGMRVSTAPARSGDDDQLLDALGF